MGGLHIFNPEHDIVLAAGCVSKMNGIPRAARLLSRDLGFLPAFWAHEGDYVLVADVACAEEAAAPFSSYLPEVHYVTIGELRDVLSHERLSLKPCPWGWNYDVRARLIEVGADSSLMPDADMLAYIRRMSSRETTFDLLHLMTDSHVMTVGERWVAHSIADVQQRIVRQGAIVVKSPWSSSGRGVKFISGLMTESEEGFIRRSISQQGCVVIEPYYDKVLDFAFEFEVKGSEGTVFKGLSIFENIGSGYAGGVLASEEDKRNILREYVPDAMMVWMEKTLVRWFNGLKNYEGPAGVDMMVVRTAEGIRIHPVVEVNLRRTMGHAAISVHHRTQGSFSRMRIVYDKGNYKLKLT